ncbi:unnamed protein product [Ilex paraguariensis]|uniref:PSD13 N-terminal domain-containing protein n=1 Tax=Ilex paraguariensis TaxID=185542 RepID=A0ABC8S8H5_9AQUA
MAALQYLESLRTDHPELSDWYSTLADLYQRKLWHQLTQKLEQFVALANFVEPGFGDRVRFLGELVLLFQNVYRVCNEVKRWCLVLERSESRLSKKRIRKLSSMRHGSEDMETQQSQCCKMILANVYEC